jgi:hypothetical protein
MTATELLKDCIAARSVEVVPGAALVTYTAGERGECDHCGREFYFGYSIIGQHDQLDNDGDFDPEVSLVFCSRACATPEGQ